VLGFDNLLYLSIEAKRAPEERQQWVRRVGLSLAIVMRVVLLVVVVKAVKYFDKPLFTLPEDGQIGWLVSGDVNVHSLVVLAGGVFILYTAVKEIMHLVAHHDPAAQGEKRKGSVAGVLASMLAMNFVFSFDSILSAMALTKNTWTMAIAVIASGLLMVWLADGVAAFLKKNRLYEVLGLFVLFIIGVMLVGEGGHLAHLHLFGHVVEPMAKSTFYFTIAILVAIDVVQAKYQKRLLAEQTRHA
jgi:predicted tellurium resistance membrane protein TerC